MKKELELRNRIKRNKPTFIRQDAHKKPEIKRKWRKPKGIHSKMRLKKRGYPRSVSHGWRSPKMVRGLHRTGKILVRVFNIQDLKRLNTETGAALIAKSVGGKKRIELLKFAQEKKITVLNVTDPAAFIQKYNDSFEERKKKKAEQKKKKEAKKKEAKKGKEKKETLNEEGKQEQEKKDKDKLLIQKK